ncbi:hypothetical protein SAMN05428978_101520 [Nitrosomonas sp. Nm34]|nr:hypothetical protein SAMN05428978_101520 [Nitrosomonas sp. Nm34]
MRIKLFYAVRIDFDRAVHLFTYLINQVDVNPKP